MRCRRSARHSRRFVAQMAAGIRHAFARQMTTAQQSSEVSCNRGRAHPIARVGKGEGVSTWVVGSLGGGGKRGGWSAESRPKREALRMGQRASCIQVVWHASLVRFAAASVVLARQPSGSFVVASTRRAPHASSPILVGKREKWHGACAGAAGRAVGRSATWDERRARRRFFSQKCSMLV